MKKKRTGRKRKSFKKMVADLTKRQKIYAAVAVSAMVLFLVMFFSISGRYNGLGMKKIQNPNQYSADCFYSEGERIFYEDSDFESDLMIDVSAYQKNIDWEKVKADGVDYAMIRLGYRSAGDGSLNLDSYFEENIEEAVNADIKVGVYFFSQAVTPEEAIEEAHFVLRHIRTKKVELPVAFDMEFIPGGDRISELDVMAKTEITDAFCSTIGRKGYTPVVYGNPTWLSNQVDTGYLTGYPLWLAHYTYSYITDYPYDFAIWQYSDEGSVKGINEYVDLNVFFREKKGIR